MLTGTSVCELSEKYPYPCIRGFHYVNLFMARNEIYPKVVEAGKAGHTLFLDLGCMSASMPRTIAVKLMLDYSGDRCPEASVRWLPRLAYPRVRPARGVYRAWLRALPGQGDMSHQVLRFQRLRPADFTTTSQARRS